MRAAWPQIALRRVDAPKRRIGFGESLRFEVSVNLNGLQPDDVVVEYRIRVYPHHEMLTHPFEMGMMIWL